MKSECTLERKRDSSECVSVYETLWVFRKCSKLLGGKNCLFYAKENEKPQIPIECFLSLWRTEQLKGVEFKSSKNYHRRHRESEKMSECCEKSESR